MSGTLDALSVLTYVCAVLGGILLLLCLLLALLLLLTHCRKNCSSAGAGPRGTSGYVVVPARTNDPEAQPGFYRTLPENHEANGGIKIPQRTDDANDLVYSVLLDETDGSKLSAEAAPIKKKLRWKRRKKRKDDNTGILPRGAEGEEEARFNAEDFDFSREGIFRKNRKRTASVRSKSDWDIFEMSTNPVTIPEKELLLTQKDEDVGKSQYFDALETIEEEKEQEVPSAAVPAVVSSDDEWSDVDENNPDPIHMRKFLNAQAKLSRNQEPLAKAVRRRVNALKILLVKKKQVEASFHKDVHKLESEFLQNKLQKVHDARQRLIEGSVEDPLSGIPLFWLHAMLNCDTLSSIIQSYDRPVLKYLIDVRVVQDISDHLDFRLEFMFAPNAFFDNTVLTKTYQVRCDPDPNEPLSFEGPEIINCTGCKIQWNRGKNVTLRAVKKLQEDGNAVIKWAKRNSFFNFFTPPSMTKEKLLDEKLMKLMDAHFDIGLHLKEAFVPKVIVYFLSDYRRSNLTGKSSNSLSALDKRKSVKMRRKSREEDRGNKKKMTSGVRNSQVPEGLTEDSEAREDKKATSEAGSEAVSEVAGVVASPGVDPVIGRYRMVSSEGFDNFMKALNVGVVKRKMANSVTPVNVIDITPEGEYVIRTETTLRTTEIRFKLEQPFPETTLDGRVTQTVATRVGDVITLNQKGDPTKREKDTQMIRDFQGDDMFMELIVGEIVCRRHYRRITD